MLPVAVAWACGILLGDWTEFPLGLLLGAGFLLWLLAGVQTRARRPLLLAAAAMGGWCAMEIAARPLSPTDLRRLVKASPVLCRVAGRIEEEPQTRPGKAGGEGAALARLRVERIRLGGRWQAASGAVRAKMPESVARRLHRGARVMADGVLRIPPCAPLPGMFDYREFLRRRGIFFLFEAMRAGDWRVTREASASLPVRFVEWAKRRLREGLFPLQQDEGVGLLYAMTLGWRAALNDETAEPFMRTGTMHIFAISGLHIVLVGGVVLSVLRVLRLPRRLAGALAIAALWFYVEATGRQVSAVRAGLIMTALVGGEMLRRPAEPFNSVLAAGFLILACDPGELFQTSFQLSFAVALMLTLWLPEAARGLREFLARDPWALAESESVWRRAARWSALRAGGLLVVSAVAWMGSAPVVANRFHLITPVGLAVNVPAVFLATGVVTAVMGSWLTGPWWPGLGCLFNHAAWGLVKALAWISEQASSLSWGWEHVSGFPPLLTLGWYGLAAGLAPWWRAGDGFRKRLAMGFGACALTGLAAAQIGEARRCELVALPNPDGGAIWADAPGFREDALIDCGDRRAAERLVVPFLQSRGVDRLPWLILTHGDARHIGGAKTLLESVRVRRVGVGVQEYRSSYWRALFAGSTPGIESGRVSVAEPGEKLAGWETLYPGEGDRFPRADDKPLVLRRRLGGAIVLIAPDLSFSAQRTLLQRKVDLRADALITGLPADGRPLSVEFLERVRPRLVVVMDADWPAERRLPAEWTARLCGAGVRVLRTGGDRPIRLVFSGNGWQILQPGAGESEESARGD